MKNFSLPALGWDNFFELQLRDTEFHEMKAGRVMAEHKTNYILLCEAGIVTGEVTGKQLYTTASETVFPKVGDWVLFAMMNDTKALIHHILLRRTQLSRRAPVLL